MKHLKKTLAALMLLASIIGSPVFAQNQDVFNLYATLKFDRTFKVKAARENEVKQERAMEVMQDNEYACTGYEEGIFFSNPLMLDGRPLDYGEFNLLSEGELTVSKGATVTGQTTQIPFYLYLRRNGTKVLIPGKEKSDSNQTKIDITEILGHAEPGDLLVIEAVRKEDGPVKRILKLIGGGC